MFYVWLMFLMVHKKKELLRNMMKKHRMDRTSYLKSTFSLTFPDIRRVRVQNKTKKTNENLNLQLVAE